MINIPVCSRSQQEANKFCIDASCLKDPFICRLCNDEVCEITHQHNGHISLIRCEQVLPRLQNLSLMADIEALDFKGLTNAAEALICQIRQIVDSYIKSMRRIRDSLTLRPEIQHVVEALRTRQYQKLKGCEMRRMVEVLNQSNPYLNKTDVFDRIRTCESKCMRLLGDLTKRIADFTTEEKRNLRPLQEKADELKKQGMLKQAADVYSEALRIEKSGRDFHNRGIIFFQLNEFEKALADYSRAIECEGSRPIYHFNKGKAYDSLQNHQEAIREFSLAIELELSYPKPEFYDERGTAYYSMGQFDKAVADYTKAVELDPKNPLYLFNRGNSFYSLRNYAMAEADYSKAILMSSGNARYYFNRGMVFSDLNKLPQAIADFSKAIELDPRDSRCHNLLGIAHQRTKNYEQAFRCFEQAIQLDTFKAEYYHNRANTLFGLKLYPEALEDYNRAIKLDRSNAEYFNNRGNTHNIQKNLIKALEDFNEAIKLNGRQPIFYLNRAIIMEQLQRYDEAEQDRRHSQQLQLQRKKN